MTDKKTTQPAEFNPIAAAVDDAIESGFFGDKHFDLPKLGNICQKRGLVGLWKQADLSKPLALFEQENKGKNEDEIDTMLSSFALAITFEATFVKRHFYAIKQGWEAQFLAELAKEETDTDKFLDGEFGKQ